MLINKEPQRERLFELFISTHEAGHAIVAAYLRVPFRYVSITPEEDGDGHIKLDNSRSYAIRPFSYCAATDSFNQRTQDELVREIHRRITNKSVMTLAARAAIDACKGASLIVPENVEVGYEQDEQNLKFYAQELGIDGTAFDEWRTRLLNKACQIVAIPFVARAIDSLATELCRKKMVTAVRCREILRETKWMWGCERSRDSTEVASITSVVAA